MGQQQFDVGRSSCSRERVTLDRAEISGALHFERIRSRLQSGQSKRTGIVADDADIAVPGNARREFLIDVYARPRYRTAVRGVPNCAADRRSGPK